MVSPNEFTYARKFGQTKKRLMQPGAIDWHDRFDSFCYEFNPADIPILLPPLLDSRRNHCI
jgi:hypothetical protein